MADNFTSPQSSINLPRKPTRRTATSVLAGDFDVRSSRDVLTSVLNSNPYKAVENWEKKRAKLDRRRRRDRDLNKAMASVKDPAKALAAAAVPSPPRAALPSTATSIPLPTLAAQDAPDAGPSTHPAPEIKDPPPSAQASSSSAPQPSPQHPSSSATKPPVYQQGRPQINIIMSRSISVTPPPLLPSRAATPVPSVSSSTSHTSSKRPVTPMDDESLPTDLMPDDTPMAAPRPRKKRQAARKGWKGWVEGSPPPSDKLINLDYAPILQERRTRNGKPFGAIGENGWV